MKKIVILTISVFYLAATAGVVVNMHYCMGSISSISFSYDADGSCNKCGMNKTEGHCCTNEVITLKLNSVQQAPTFSFSLSSLSAAIPVQQQALHEPLQGISVAPATDYFSPPPNVLNKVYISIQVFRI